MHATLGRRMTAEQVGLAVAVLSGELDGQADLPAEADGLRRWDSDERVDHLLVG